MTSGLRPTSSLNPVTDPDGSGQSLTLTGTTTNASLMANGGIAIAPTSSTATSRTFSVTLTPAPGATGFGGVTLSAGDGVTTVTRTVNLSVTSSPAAPDAPTTLTAVVTGSALQLTWTAATTGTPATSYEVSVGLTPGAELVITRNDQPIAELHRTAGAPPQPRFGSCRGNLTILAEDDEHLRDFEEYLP